MCCSSAFTKKTSVLTEMCFVLLAFIFPDLVWCYWHIIKQIFHAFLFNVKIIHPRSYNIQLRF